VALSILPLHNRGPVITLRMKQKERNREKEGSLKSFAALGGLSLHTVKEKSFPFFSSECAFPPSFSVKGIVPPVINVLFTA